MQTVREISHQQKRATAVQQSVGPGMNLCLELLTVNMLTAHFIHEMTKGVIQISVQTHAKHDLPLSVCSEQILATNTPS